MSHYRLVPLLGLLLGATACDQIQDLMGGPKGEEVVAEANAALKSGDLPGAYAKYEKSLADNPDNEYALLGAAYAQMLAGEFEKADKTLAGAEGKLPEKAKEIKLRRAIVALREGNLDGVKEHATASGLPAGQVLAAEVHLVDAEQDEAISLLKQAANDAGTVGDTAKQYLELLESGDKFKQALGEASALWAVGQKDTAVDQAHDAVKEVSDPKKGELLLLWAGRAVTIGKADIATSLIEASEFAEIPPEHQWRVQATKAMVQVVSGDADGAVATFDALAGLGAPADGLADARATAAALAKDRESAKKIAGDVESAAVGRSLSEAGAEKVAAEQTPDGALKRFLENK